MGKIYTKSGDDGYTSIIGGKRLSKASERIEAYGNVDECNSIIGVINATIKYEDIRSILAKIQNDLFAIGSDLADPSYPNNPYNTPRIGYDDITCLEQAIDEFEKELEPIRYFILPSGSKEGALLHFARAIARRAERSIVRLAEKEQINKHIIVYMNRLSDLLFVLARVVNKREGIKDVAWKR